MTTRRNFLKGLAAAPAVLAADPKGIALALEEAELVAKAKSTLARSRLLPGVLVASGGFCAPLSPTYDFPFTGSPVRAALPTVRAKRSS